MPLHYITSAGLCSCGNPECRSAGKHPIGNAWQHNVYRMTDPLPWDGHPQFNIGIATGAPSGFWVLDYDPAAPGVTEETHDIVRQLCELYGPHVETGGTGSHWRFEMPVDFEVTNRRGTLPAGLDVRGTGGQVVAPPSVSGKGAYVELPTPGDGAPYVAPEWLLDMIRPASPLPREAPAGWSPHSHAPVEAGTGSGDDRGQRYARAAVDDMLAELAATSSGRNTAAFTAACRILEFANAGWLSEAPAVVGAWNLVTHAHPLGIVVPASEVESIWRSAQRKVGDRPAELPPEWTDPLRVEVWPAPPVDAAGVPPFSPSSPNGASSYRVPAFSEPSDAGGAGVATANGSRSATPTDPRWEVAVQAEVNRQLVRAAARQRLAELESGDLAAVKARLRGELLDTPALLARPRLQPLVEGLLFRNTLVRIVGRPGHGKSFVTLDLAAHVVNGMPWAGRRTYATRGAYVVAEGDEGFGGRVAAWRAHHGRDVELIYLPRAVQIGGPEWRAWCEIMAEDGHGQIYIDTQARATVGRDEIDGKDMGEVTDALDDLRKMTNAMVALVHHTNASGGTTGRGHGGMLGALETELFVSMDGRVITVKGGKSKDTAKPEDIVFDLVDVPAPTVEGFSEPGPAAILGVVPVWRGTSVVAPDGTVREPRNKTRARLLWQVIQQRYNPGMGGTYAECRQAFGDVAWASTGLNTAGFRSAWSRAWADLIQRGLLAKSFNGARFKVVELADQGADGVLTSNLVDGKMISEGPIGFEVLLTDVTDSDKRALQ